MVNQSVLNIVKKGKCGCDQILHALYHSVRAIKWIRRKNCLWILQEVTSYLGGNHHTLMAMTGCVELS